MEWSARIEKLTSREFICTVAVEIFAGIAMLRGVATFTEWAVFAGGVALGYQGIKGYKDAKTNGSTTSGKSGE